MKEKIALVTGASRGIGKAIAISLARDGYTIVGMSTKEAVMTEKELKLINDASFFVQGDLSDSTDRKRVVNSCLEQFGKIDVLVDNAGVAPRERMDMLSATEESFDYVMNINLKGTFFLTQLVARAMIDGVEKKIQEHPKIITLSSISSYTSSVQRAEYCISKAGISMMTRLFADRLAEHGIHVYEVRPGIILTDMTQAVKEKYDKLIEEGLLPIHRWGLPEDVGKAVSALCNDSFLYSTGQVIDVDGGFHLRRL